MLNSLRHKIYNLLRKSEKWTQTDMVYLTKGGFWLTLGQIVSSISSFLLAIAFANFLSPENYGIYKYVLSVCGVLVIFTLPGMNIAMVRAISRGFEGSFSQAFLKKIKWGVLGSISSIGIASYYFFQGNEILGISFLIAGIFIPVFDSFNIYLSILNGRKNFKLTTKFNIIAQTFSFMSIVSALVLSNNIIWIILAYFLSNSLIRSILLMATIKKSPINQNKDGETISYGKSLSIMNALGTISGQIDKILIFHYLGSAELAVYAFAYAPISQIRSLLTNIKPLALPKFAEQKNKITSSSYFKKIKLLIIFLTLVIVFYIIIAPHAFHLLFPQYLESIKFSQILTLSLFGVIGILNNSFLQAQLAKKELYIVTIIMPIFQIIITLIGIIYLGLVGAVLAFIVFKLSNALLSTYLVQKNIQKN